MLEKLIPKESPFFNQLESFPNLPVLGKRACGPSGAATAINILTHRSSHNRVTPLEIMQKAVTIQEIPPEWGMVWAEYSGTAGDFNSPALSIPIGEANSPSVGKIRAELAADQFQSQHVLLRESLRHPNFSMEETRQRYHPIFSLGRGWDHRGSNALFNEYGLDAMKLGGGGGEKIAAEDIVEVLQAKHLLMLSVEHKDDSSHLVLLTSTRKSGWGKNRTKEIKVYDSLKNQPEWINLQDWYQNKFRGFGTVIYNNQRH